MRTPEGEAVAGAERPGGMEQAEAYQRLGEEAGEEQGNRVAVEAPRQAERAAEATLPQTEVVDHQWDFMTAATQRAMLERPEVRVALTKFCREPVSQRLPAKMIAEVSDHAPLVAKLYERFQTELGTALAQEIPEEGMENGIIAAAQQSKITPEQAEFAGDQYRRARDVKILALAAELQSQPDLRPSETGSLDLPSGIHLQVDPADPELGRRLLDSTKWQKREQRKDRVYDVEVDGRHYILKERKTNRHMDVTGNELGAHHEDGRTAAEEHVIGRQLHEQGRVETGPVRVAWEKPLAYAEYPDGFQFGVFEFEKDLVTERGAFEGLTRQIFEHPDQYEEEYQRVSEAAKQTWDHEYARLPWEKPSTSDRGPKAWMGRGRNRYQGVTYDEFVDAKARFMIVQAFEAMVTARREQRFLEPDSEGYGFRLPSSAHDPLEIVGMDYEYYMPFPDSAEADRVAGTKARIDVEEHLKDSFETRGGKAAYLALEELAKRADSRSG